MIRVQLTFFIFAFANKNPPRRAGQKCKRPHEAAFCEKWAHEAPHEGSYMKNRLDPTTAVSVQESQSWTLTAAQFHQFAAVPAETEWFANLDNPRTRRAYQTDPQNFMGFAGIKRPEEFRIVTRSHVLAWRKTLADRALSGATIRRKFAALSSLFEYLCEKNAVDFNPVKGAKRPKVESNEGKTPALGDHQARALLDAPDPETLKASAIARCCRCCCITACAGKSSAC